MALEARRDEEDRQMKEAQERMRAGGPAVQRWMPQLGGSSLDDIYIYII